MKRSSPYLLIIFILVGILPLKGQNNVSAGSIRFAGVQADPALLREENPLFLDEEVLQLKLSMDVKAVLKDRGEKSSYHKAIISYQEKSGKIISEELKVRVRGKRRRDAEVCKFPPLLLNFKRATVQNTVFGKVNKLKLVTHCITDDYVLQEYLVYKLYNIVTDKSFRVRLCQVTYEDVQGKRKPEKKYAFLIEDEADMAARNGGSIMPDDLKFRMDRTDSLSMAMLAVFQYMIGNTDWSVPYQHNIKILHVDSLYFSVPFDFDYCGLVNAPYAQPPPELGIESVKQRLFRGYSFTQPIYDEVSTYYKEHKKDFYQVYHECKPLGKKSKKSSIRYLDSFYKVLNDPKDFQKEIVRVGEYNAKSYIIIKGLE
ncbi:hypothetical protein ACSX1A_01775 [Pontibacter sp. MBLB2868]|uniref:hypothetical protein n=1 Tax=Pontibacter sp. MBLB2868 TaxID=3451555 RepID=UPI003F756482